MEPGARIFEIFLDVQRGLPRQGPGCGESTRRALSLCRGLPAEPCILDVGCGPGMQTLVLAQELGGRITAVDLNQEYLDELNQRAGTMAAGGGIETLLWDMNELVFAEGMFDLIWSEGAAYIMGVENAAEAWKRFLKPGGYLALTELVWLEAQPPAEAAAFFGEEYPAMTDVKGVEGIFRRNGYDVIGHFTLPDAAWWENYYTPLASKLPVLYEKYRGDEVALSVVRLTEREIEIRRRFG